MYGFSRIIEMFFKRFQQKKFEIPDAIILPFRRNRSEAEYGVKIVLNNSPLYKLYTSIAGLVFLDRIKIPSFTAIEVGS